MHTINRSCHLHVTISYTMYYHLISNQHHYTTSYQSYGTAILDPKRRQGFIRTILDFQTTLNSIQKKLMLLNKHKHQMKCKTNKFPLVLSSGSRQNYTLGTSDEGVLAFRKMDDVNCLVSTLLGGGDSTGWFDTGVDDAMSDDRNHKKKQVIMSAADRVLTRASDRALGVVSTSSSQGDKKRKQRGWDSRSHVVSIGRMEQGCVDTEDEEDDGKVAASLVDWLSEPSRTKEVKEEVDCVEEAAKPNQIEGSESTVFSLDRSNTDESSKLFKSVDKGAGASATQEKIDDSEEEEEDKNDIEDGYIAL